MRYFEAADLPPIVRVPSQGLPPHRARHATWAPRASCCRWSATSRKRAHILDSHEVPSRRASAASRSASRMTATGRARSPTKLAAANAAHHLLLPDRDGGRRQERRCASRRSTASTACGSAISTCRSRSAFPASSAIRNSRRRSTRWSPPAKKHKKALGRLVPNVEQGIDILRMGLRLHLLFRRCLGAAQRAGRGGREAARRLQEEVRARPWPTSSASRCRATSRRRTARRPIPDFDLEPLQPAPGVEIVYLENRQSDPRRAARGFRRADPADAALRARQRARRAAGWRSSRASASATTRSTSTPAPRPASRWSSRPTACAGRSRSRSSP